MHELWKRTRVQSSYRERRCKSGLACSLVHDYKGHVMQYCRNVLTSPGCNGAIVVPKGEQQHRRKGLYYYTQKDLRNFTRGEGTSLIIHTWTTYSGFKVEQSAST